MGSGEDTTQSTKGESVQQQRDREEVERQFQERKMKAKKRRDAAQQQLQKVLNEKQVRFCDWLTIKNNCIE